MPGAARHPLRGSAGPRFARSSVNARIESLLTQSVRQAGRRSPPVSAAAQPEGENDKEESSKSPWVPDQRGERRLGPPLSSPF